MPFCGTLRALSAENWKRGHWRTSIIACPFRNVTAASCVHDIQEVARASRNLRNSPLFSGLRLPPRQCSLFQSFPVDRGISFVERSPLVQDLGYIGTIVRGDFKYLREGWILFLPHFSRRRLTFCLTETGRNWFSGNARGPQSSSLIMPYQQGKDVNDGKNETTGLHFHRQGIWGRHPVYRLCTGWKRMERLR